MKPINKVGIVIVTHNASQAVRITLASLRQAKNAMPSKVILVDNASYEMEREQIRSAFERHLQETSLPWEYIQLDKNAGFSGGNNVGIRHFLDDPEISHICFLNSDVIVTDYWLDHLIDTQFDIVSAVTNKAESEQCIPIDYTIAMDECLDEQTERVHASCLSRVESFAEDWYKAWCGNWVEGEATFFCVLIARQVFHDLGILDETFFPGGYEDDDFCLRARQFGYKVWLARDVFIHHWGSASFGQLQYEYFNANASRNLEYLEKKHGITRRRRPEKPFTSFLMDVKFAAIQKNTICQSLRKRFHTLYITQLDGLLGHFESEFVNLNRTIRDSGWTPPPVLQAQIGHAMKIRDLTALWKSVVSKTDVIFAGDFDATFFREVVSDIEYIIEGVWTRVECNFAIHTFLMESRDRRMDNKTNPISQLTISSVLRKFTMGFQSLVKGVRFLWKLQGVVFFGGYPYPERQSDGYFQRIQMVDRLFMDRWRIYVEGGHLSGREHWFDRPEAKVLVLRVARGRMIQRLMAKVLAMLSILKCRRVYFHSILTMRSRWVALVLNIPGLTRIIDVHGVVTEEFRLHDDFYNAMIYEHVERMAINKCDVIVVVSRAMEHYLLNKYRGSLRGRVVLFPMFPNYPTTKTPRPFINGKPVIVYAGGLQKWQQVPKMVDAISHTAALYEYRFFSPDPLQVQKILPEKVRPYVITDHKTRDELLGLYPKCHYGFILREDNVVNHTACPTKLVEYLAMGLVPIVNAEDIGDFKAMGMQSVSVDALIRNTLPDETIRLEMADANFLVYERLHQTYKQGAYDIRAMVSNKSLIWNEGPRLKWIKGLLPPNTRLGRLARMIWMKLKALLSGTKKAYDPVVGSILSECDVLVQVDNFEAGGLENIVLDINDALLQAGIKITLLVLGKPGVGVERARERGITVLIGSPDKTGYRAIIEQIRPQLVLAHYSIFGVKLCRELGIPFVQVIQNTYMWFDEKQLVAFEQAASLTTAFISLSEYAQKYSVKRLGIDEKRSIVLPCGIDVSSLEGLNRTEVRKELRSRLGLDESDFVFLSVGAVNHQKNHIATVRAFVANKSKFPHAKLVILGPAYEPQLLREMMNIVEKQKLTNRVIYAGSAPSAYMYYAMSDAFVSAAFFEGGPLNLLEAVSANLPTIITNVGLARHFIGLPGITIIDPPVDINEFRGKIWQLTSNKEFEEKLANAMLNIYQLSEKPEIPPDILHMFDKSYAYDLYVKLIKDLLQGKGIDEESVPPTWVSAIEKMPRA